MNTIELVAERLPDLETAMVRATRSESYEAMKVLGNRGGSRLADWVNTTEWGLLGMGVRHDAEPAAVAEHNNNLKPWNAETVAAQITTDVEFAFTKALGQRGISASMMHEVCMMWSRILDLGIDEDDYAQYGLPGIKALAVALDLPNPIGDDHGGEFKYSEYG